MFKYSYNFFVLIVLFVLSSCSAPRDITYFDDIDQGSNLSIPEPYMLRVQNGDKLQIIVSVPDSRLSYPLNLQLPGNGREYGSDAAYNLGYTVSPEGYINFPQLGSIQVNGLTREQIERFITNELITKGIVNNPTVLVNYLNQGVAVLGDVNNPGWKELPRDRYTILEAIADAGDLNITGERRNVKLLRDTPTDHQVYEVNLQDANQLCHSPAFFLQPNDIIYIEPNAKQKKYSEVNANITGSATFYISLGTLLTSIASIFITK